MGVGRGRRTTGYVLSSSVSYFLKVNSCSLMIILPKTCRRAAWRASCYPPGQAEICQRSIRNSQWHLQICQVGVLLRRRTMSSIEVVTPLQTTSTALRNFMCPFKYFVLALADTFSSVRWLSLLLYYWPCIVQGTQRHFPLLHPKKTSTSGM